MKKSLLATTFVVFPLSAKTTRLNTYGCVAIVLLAGCTATQTRWDATNIRKEVMVYYNDQIMDNLIRAKNHLPFVHVDISLLTSQGSSQISGTIGGGETTTNTGTQQQTNQSVRTNTTSATPSNMVAGTIGVVGMLAHAAMRPFTYSVTPQQTETLSIQAAPALGSQAIASMSEEMTTTKKTDEIDIEADLKTPTPTPTPIATSTTKKTTKTDEIDIETNAKTPTPTPTKITTKVTKENTQKPFTIYQLYDCFAEDRDKWRKECEKNKLGSGHLSHQPKEPPKDAYVPGTLKKGPTPEGGIEYYFIANNDRDKKEYYEFCIKLFIKGQSQTGGTGGLERALQQTQAAAALPTR